MTSYGLTVFNDGYGPVRFRRLGELAAQAEDAGFDAVWTSELYNRSATIPMAVLAQATERVRVGANIAYGVGRSPLIWAAEARDLDELSGGRIVLGLGNGTARMMSDWHGVDGDAPAVRMEELVEVLRKLWSLHEGPVHHDGRFYRLHLAPTAETPPPFRPRLPIWTAGVNGRMVRAAGKVADGLVGHPMFTPAYLAEVVRPELERGAKEAGRDPSEIDVMGILICAVDDDEERARRTLAFCVAQYAASRVFDRLFAVQGWEAHQDAIRVAIKARDTDAITAAVPDDMLDALGVACRPEHLAQQVARHAVDYDHLALTGPPWGVDAAHSEQSTLAILEGMRAELTTRSPAHPSAGKDEAVAQA